MLIIAVATITAVALPLVAQSHWSYTAPPVTAPVSAATIPTPTQFTCKASGGLLGIGSTADFSWSALPAGTAWRYQVWVRNPDGSTNAPFDTAGQTATSIKIGSGLLTGLLGGILDLLTGGGQAQVRVVAVHPSGWTAASTPEIPIRRASLLGGITC